MEGKWASDDDSPTRHGTGLKRRLTARRFMSVLSLPQRSQTVCGVDAPPGPEQHDCQRQGTEVLADELRYRGNGDVIPACATYSPGPDTKRSPSSRQSSARDNPNHDWPIVDMRLEIQQRTNELMHRFIQEKVKSIRLLASSLIRY